MAEISNYLYDVTILIYVIHLLLTIIHIDAIGRQLKELLQKRAIVSSK